MLYMCISHEEDIVFAFTIKINFFFMILRSIAILLMSPLNIFQQRYLYWNDLTVCIVSLYNLLLCILLLYNHCNDFAPCGILIIGIKNILSYLILSYIRSQPQLFEVSFPLISYRILILMDCLRSQKNNVKGIRS